MVRDGALHAYITRHKDFLGDALVECPQCSKKAWVKTPGYPQEDWEVYEDTVSFSCFHCGKAQRLKDITKTTIMYNSHGTAITSRVLRGGNSMTDPFFGYRLWLNIECLEGNIWAYNPEHLRFLQQFIAATHRKRQVTQDDDVFNNSIGSRLPRWMTAAKNRGHVLKCIARLMDR